MRYTPEATMEQHGLRDVDRWKDKIEVRLDNRQVAFLFFGSALIACLLFILGVIVGKRLESRGRALAPEIEDPLTLLDRVATSRAEEQPGAARAALTAVERKPRKAETAPLVIAKPEPPKASKAETAARPADKRETLTASAPAPAARPAPPTAKEVEPTTPKPSAAVASVAPPAAPATVSRAAAPTSGAVETRPAAVATEPEAEPTRAPAPATATAETGKKLRYSLQISAFQDRAEAEAFASSFAAEGPEIKAVEIPGKGTGVWYRVFVGNFKSYPEAVEAKAAFERRYNKIALVAGPR